MHHGKFKTRFHVHEIVKIQIHADLKWIYTKNNESRKNKSSQSRVTEKV